jgi:ubiquinone/menaquinone biosynthesis C-methylase UbiE
MSLEELKERSRRVWGTGDYRPTSRQLEPASTMLVDALGVVAGHRVLDVGAGDGNCAMAAARRGATVHAADFAPTMVASGQQRTRAEGLQIDWWEADAADLPFDDEEFDRVTSVFGAIFAPEQEDVVAEAARVTRPGGRIGFTAWTPDSYTARLMEVTQWHGPPLPAEAPNPLRWGSAEEVEALFARTDCAVDVRRRAVAFRYDSWEDCRSAIEAHGMAVVAKQRMPADTYEQMFDDIRELIASVNHAEGDAIAYDADYLEIVATKP